jgi:carbon-monoxide dehydrogenase medium subunit
MFPARFDYHAPEALADAIALLAELGPEAKVLAGGASLVPLMKLRLAEPAHLVDIRRIPGLDTIEVVDGELRIGALVRQADLLRAPAAATIPAITDACAVVADPSVRNMGTIGGNLAHGDPANDHPAIMLALGARLVARGPGGEREIPAESFSIDLLQVDLLPDEVLTTIVVPSPAPRSASAYVKFERQVGDFATAAAAAAVTLDAAGRIEACRVTFTNLAPTPVRSPSIEGELTGRLPDDAVVAAAVAALREIDPWSDLRGTAEVKWSMARAAAIRAIQRAVERARRVSEDE